MAALILTVWMSAMSVVRAAEATIEPLVEVNWNQQTPWNFYLPVLGNDSGDGAYAGCVGTMLAQLMSVYRWPVHFEDTLEKALKTEYTSPITLGHRERLRCDEAVPLDWNELADSPLTYRQKHLAARVTQFADLTLSMVYEAGGSTSSIGYGLNANQIPYYESPGVIQTDALDWQALGEQIHASLAAGCPVGAEIKYDGSIAHAIIFDGWRPAANEDAAPEVHLNYGWGGNKTGWYALDALPDTIRAIAPFFRPVPRAQFAPLAGEESAPVLRWDFPSYWATRGLCGWRLETWSSAGVASGAWMDDFSGILDPCVATDSQDDQRPVFTVGPTPDDRDADNGSAEANYLLVKSVADTHPKLYNWPQIFVPDATSELSFRLQPAYTQNQRLAVQIKAGAEPWSDLAAGELSAGAPGSETAYAVSLAPYAGKPCRLRLRVRRGEFDVESGGTAIYEGVATWRFRDWRVSGVRLLEASGTIELEDASARTYAPAAVAPGTVCAYRLTPLFDTADTVGVASAPVATTIRETPCAAAAILSVTDASGRELDEGLRRACAPRGRTVLKVRLAAGAELLTPTCSNMDFITPDDWSVHSAGVDTYALTFTLAGKSAKAQQAYVGNAVMVTLRARDAVGGFAAKDVMLQFVEATASEANPATGEVDPGDDSDAEGSTGEPDLGGDATARHATEIASSDGLSLIRFAPGLVRGEDGAWSGWSDNSLLNTADDREYGWAFAAADAFDWWLDNFRRQGGVCTPGDAAAPYVSVGATSGRGYPSPVVDALLDSWSNGLYGYKAEFAMPWLFCGTAVSLGDDWATLKDTEIAGTGLLAGSISAALIPDLTVYCGSTTTSYAEDSTSEEDVRRGFADYLLEALRHGPVLTALYDNSYLVIWGAEATRESSGSEDWTLGTVYYTNPATPGQTLESSPLAFVKSWGSYCPVLGDELVVYRTASVYAYGHANGQISSGGGAVTPEPDPDDDAATIWEPPEDPAIADEDLSAHYGYAIVRDYHHARRLALEQGKALFVLSGADWCSWCSRVKAYLQGVPDFARDFVVYYASRESSDASPYFHGSLPQYGTFDPRLADPLAGTLQTDGTRIWANAWVSAGNGQYDSQRGYSEARIDECLVKARAAWRRDLAEDPQFTLTGATKVLVGETAKYALRATFPADGAVMTLDHRVRWEIVCGPAVLADAGTLKAVAAGEIVLRATSLDDYAPLVRDVVVTAVDAGRVESLALPERIINLEDDPRPQLFCHAVLDDGTEVPVQPDVWQVEIVPGSRVPLEGFELGEEIAPEISSAGELVYRTVVTIGQGVESVNICNHRLKVTAVRGDEEVVREYTVYGPSQVRPVALELLSSARCAPGAVVRLKVGQIAYTYGERVVETTDTSMAAYWNNISSLTSSTAGDWQIAIPVAAKASGTYAVNVGARKQGGAYTSYVSTAPLAKSLVVAEAGAAVADGRYANVTTGYLGAYFPERTADEALATEDSDGDGYLNWQEFLLGTEPDKADDAFAFTAQHFSACVADADVNLYYKVMFTVRPERNYVIEAKERWDDVWTEVGSFDAETRTVPSIAERDLADRAKFFRVSVGFSESSGGKAYSSERFTPVGLAIAPGAELDLTGETLPLTLTALAMDDYAPGHPTIRLAAGLEEGTPVLRAPESCARWMELFRPADSDRYAFKVKTASDGWLELVTAAPLPRPLPPAGDTIGVYSDSACAHLGAAAAAAGLTQDFDVRVRRGFGAARAPDSVDEVNALFACFKNLRIAPDAQSGAMVIDYDFAVERLVMVAGTEGNPAMVVALRVTSAGEGEAPVDFAEGVDFEPVEESVLGGLPSGTVKRQVTGPDGATDGVSDEPGLRYLRIDFPAADTTTPRLFRVRVTP
ncbi:MAG: C10 family peptidase [Kiritimatiellia bacterium]